MTKEELIRIFTNIRCATTENGYAPHKPILILLLFEKIFNHHINNFLYKELDHDLHRLLAKYGSSNAHNTRNEPFWRLKNDGLVEIEAPDFLLNSENTPSVHSLIENEVAATFTTEIYSALNENPQLISEIAQAILTKFISPTYNQAILAEAAPSIQQLSRSYWWVSQNQTYRQEVPGNFMWSPKANRNGGNNASYNFMTEMRVGDIVFSFADTFIKAIGVVIKEATPSLKPDFGNAGANWSDDGWLVEVQFRELKQASFKPSLHMELISPTLPERHSPIRSNGVGNLLYLAEVPTDMANILIGLSGPFGSAIVKEIVKDISFEIPQVAEVDQEIQMRTDIGETQKTQIIQSRRGQGVFKANVRLVEQYCRVTKVSNPKHLIASHIKPWSKSDDTEKLSGFNGLLLSPHIDQLFDKGHISFQNNGQIILSDHLDKKVLDQWNIPESINVGKFKPEQQVFMEYHRDVILI